MSNGDTLRFGCIALTNVRASAFSALTCCGRLYFPSPLSNFRVNLFVI